LRGSRYLAEVIVKLEVVPQGKHACAEQATRFRVTVIDYGPGIVRQQIPRSSPSCCTFEVSSFAHEPRQQGIGISAPACTPS